MVQINGWGVLAHPLFLKQLENLIEASERERKKDPRSYQAKPNTKLLAHLRKLAFEVIPSDPTHKDFRQGDTLGPEYTSWFRGKYGGGRYRLFFRFDTSRKVILLAWVNDEHSKRTRGSKKDAYAVFRGMLESGNPPTDWDELFKACCDQRAVELLSGMREPE